MWSITAFAYYVRMGGFRVCCGIEVEIPEVLICTHLRRVDIVWSFSSFAIGVGMENIQVCGGV